MSRAASSEPSGLRRTAVAATRLGFLAVALLCGPVTRAARTDVIVVENGDAVTGEIKQLDRGILRYKTDSAGTLQVEWEEVLSIRSVDSFEIETVSGGRFFGSLALLDRDAPSVTVVGADRTVDLYLENIVRINPVKDSFFRRIDGSLSLGYDYTKASDISKLNFAFRADYRARMFVTGVSLSTNVTTQPEQPTTSRSDATYYFERFRLERWFTRWSGNLQSNDEIGLDLRAQTSWIGGRYLTQTNHALFSVGGGLAVSREIRSGKDENQNNLDLVLTTDYQFFKFKSPKRDLSVSLFAYPSLSSWGRVRSDLDARLRFELFTDFFLEFSVYGTYDNQPPEGATSSADYGFVTSVSWTF